MGIGQAFSEFAEWFYNTVNSWLEWVRGLFEYLAAWVLEQLLSGVAAIIEAMPVPGAFAEAAPAWGSVMGAAGFFLEPWQVGPGLTMFFSALGLRFLLRRIPFVGG